MPPGVWQAVFFPLSMFCKVEAKRSLTINVVVPETHRQPTSIITGKILEKGDCEERTEKLVRLTNAVP